MSAEENKAIGRRAFEELWNRGNLDVVDEICTEDYVLHDPAVPEEVRGPDGLRRYVAMFREAFPDIEFAVEDELAEGDRVAMRWSAKGTHRGELMGIPPTGNRVETTGMLIYRVSGGKSAEAWVSGDDLGMMQQIGAIPSPEQAARS